MPYAACRITRIWKWGFNRELHEFGDIFRAIETVLISEFAEFWQPKTMLHSDGNSRVVRTTCESVYPSGKF